MTSDELEALFWKACNSGAIQMRQYEEAIELLRKLLVM
jgi:hypothetical protein